MRGAGQQHPMPMTVIDMGCNPEERAVLNIARSFFQTFANPESQSWISAFPTACNDLTGRSGAEIALAVLRCVQAIGQARKSGFVFSNPQCANCSLKLSECERQFIGAFRGRRKGDRSAAHVNAMLLCEGHDFGPFLNALDELCILLDMRESAPVSAPAVG